MLQFARPGLFVLGMLVTTACDAGAQRIKRSQRGSVTQWIGDTEVAIAYSRPVARGRTLFGELVKWGEVWHPGADSATTIAVSAPVLVAGDTLPAGTYSVWTIPYPEAWTVIFSRKAKAWHAPYPGEEHDQLRVSVRIVQRDHLETLTFHFPVVDGPRAVLALQWGETAVELPIDLIR